MDRKINPFYGMSDVTSFFTGHTVRYYISFEKMNVTTLSMLGRVVERLMLVAAGIVLIVLGYHLYLNGVGGEAKIRVETAGQAYQLENATPGIIFALLGAIVLGRSVLSPLKIEATTAAGGAHAEKMPTVADSRSSKLSAEELAHQVVKELRIFYSDTATMPSGFQLPLEDIDELYRAVFAVVSDRSIDSRMRNALADAYRRIYEKNKLGPDGAARLQKLRETSEKPLTPEELHELRALAQKIPSEYSPERFGVTP